MKYALLHENKEENEFKFALTFRVRTQMPCGLQYRRPRAAPEPIVKEEKEKQLIKLSGGTLSTFCAEQVLLCSELLYTVKTGIFV